MRKTVFRTIWSVAILALLASVGWTGRATAQSATTATATNALAPFNEITGVVIDDYDGRPVPRIMVYLCWDKQAGGRASDDGVTDSALTDAQGRFVIATRKEQNQPFVLYIGSADRAVSVMTPLYPATPPTPLEIHLPKDGEWIVGQVMWAEAGEPARRGTVQIFPASAPPYARRAVAAKTPDPDGIFILGPVAPGLYDVQYSVSLGSTKHEIAKPGIRTVPLGEIETARVVIEAPSLPRPTPFEVRVLEPTGEPARFNDTVGPPTGEKFVRTADFEPVIFNGEKVTHLLGLRRKDDGVVQFSPPDAGHLLVAIKVEDGFGILDTNLEPAPDGTLPRQTVTLRRGDSRIAGRVLDADGRAYNAGGPANQRPVVFKYIMNPPPTDGLSVRNLNWQVRADEDGYFTGPPLPPGPYWVQVPGSLQPSAHEVTWVQIEHRAGEDTVVTVVRKPGAEMIYQGHVSDRSGRPVAGAQVTLVAADGTPLGRGPATTDPQGHWLLQGARLPAHEGGDVLMGYRIDHPDYSLTCAPVGRMKPETMNQLTLDPPANLRVRLVPKTSQSAEAQKVYPWTPELWVGPWMFEPIPAESQAAPGEIPPKLEWTMPRVPRGVPLAFQSRLGERNWYFGEPVWHLDNGTTLGRRIALPREGAASEILVEFPLTFSGLQILETSLVRFRLIDADSGRPASDVRLSVSAATIQAKIKPEADGSCQALLERTRMRISIDEGDIVESSRGEVRPLNNRNPMAKRSAYLNPDDVPQGEEVVLKVERRR
jgi:protocatechuate 3,4-dioxygenase beta subunit